MEDPRIEELMEFIDSVDGEGKPTALALIARRVEGYLEVVDGLKEELVTEHNAVSDLEIRASNLAESLAEREPLRAQIQDEAQTATMKASVATTTGQAALLRTAAEEKQKALKQYETDFEDDQRRYKNAVRALDMKQDRLMEIREQVARRMNIVDALIQRAEIEWPSYFFDENERIKAQKQREAAGAPRRRRRRGGRRMVIRRRRAS